MRFRNALFVGLVACFGCSSRPERFEAPEVDVDAAATQAIELYDANGDKALSEEELAKCPGMLGRMPAYDRNDNKAIEQEEIAQHLRRLLNRTGGTPLTALVFLKGRKLSGATVTLEPEPYLGGEVQKAEGVTDGAGAAELTVAPEYMPEHLRRLKLVHYGTFKVRIEHPTISIPAKYNTETELGYETEPGKPIVRFQLN